MAGQSLTRPVDEARENPALSRYAHGGGVGGVHAVGGDGGGDGYGSRGVGAGAGGDPSGGDGGDGCGCGGGGSSRSTSLTSWKLLHWRRVPVVVLAISVVLLASAPGLWRGRSEDTTSGLSSEGINIPRAARRLLAPAAGGRRVETLKADRKQEDEGGKFVPDHPPQSAGGGNVGEGQQEKKQGPSVAHGSVAGQGEVWGKGEGGQQLPQCFSSAAADPSRGAWRKCEGGVEESPVDMVDWVWETPAYEFYQSCNNIWRTEHAGGGEMPYWKWEPRECRLEDVDATKFCRVMEGRKGLLFVGDSLTQIMVTTLASILRADVRSAGEAEKRLEGKKRNSSLWSACEGKLNITFIRNDYMDTREEEFEAGSCGESHRGRSHCTAFALDSILREFDTLVVNSGAHHWAGGWEEYEEAMKVSAAKITSSMRRMHGENAILVVRNTVPGHWGCQARMFKGPVELEVANRLVEQAPKNYEWGSFSDNNVLLEEAFSIPGGGWRVLDAYTPTLLRSDLHHGRNGPSMDCLHYCVPGPVDHWVTLLFNILLAETAERS